MAKLDRELDGLAGVTVEVHASAAYVDPIQQLLTSAGARVELPLRNVPWVDWPAWYDQELLR